MLGLEELRGGGAAEGRAGPGVSASGCEQQGLPPAPSWLAEGHSRGWVLELPPVQDRMGRTGSGRWLAQPQCWKCRDFLGSLEPPTPARVKGR